MQDDPRFLASRASPALRIVEEIHRGGDAPESTRTIPCGIRELYATGWHLLPSASRLAETGTTYGSPEYRGSDRVAITLGPAEGSADAKYFFRARAGAWQLVRVELYSYLEPGAPLPPLPCNAKP